MKKLLQSSILLIIVLLGACSREDVKLPEQPLMLSVAQPVILETDSTHIVLGDYFLAPGKIDSIATDENLGHIISPDSSEVILFVKNKALPKLSAMNIYSDEIKYTILLRKSPKVWYHFTFDPGEKQYKKVYLAGDMNDWVPGKTVMKLNDKKWETDVFVYPGKYQYKFVVDGRWMSDPANSERSGSNSVVYIGNVHPQRAPALNTIATEKDEITLGFSNDPEKIYVLWENYLLDEKFWKKDTVLHVKIPSSAGKLDRSTLRIYAVNDAGISNEIMIPLKGSKVVMETADLSRTDPRAMTIYFMMIDRFMNGDTANDAPLADPEVDPKLNYMGGDISGITKKADEGYFKDLGVNTLWISPVTQNPKDAWKEYPAPHRKFSGYHGYWPVSLTSIDNRYGTSDELKDLVKEVHGENMNILLDYVSNHLHQEAPLIKAHPDWATPAVLADGKKNIRLWNEQRLTTWFDEFLPTLDLLKPEVCQVVSDSAVYMLQEYGFDGFRHDAAKHVPEVYWRTLTKKIKDKVVREEKRNIYQIGETFGSRELINSYINPGMMDGQFDFSVFFDASSAFASDAGMKDLNASLWESFFYFGNHHVMGNISGNQDLARFISYASGALDRSEDPAEAGWKRDIEVKDTVGYSKLAMLMAFNMTIPGVPIIYYGDEFGMPGAGDPDNRRMMKFENLNPHEQKTKAITQQLLKLRRENMALVYGDFSNVQVSENTWIYMRTYFDKIVFVIMNKSNTSKKLTFDVPKQFEKAQLKNNFGNVFNLEGGKISIDLKGNSFEVISN